MNVDEEREAGGKLDDYDSEGVDLTLVRWMLSLSPEDRLRFLDKRINEIRAIQDLNGVYSTSDFAFHD